jgi:hypothetical protein
MNVAARAMIAEPDRRPATLHWGMEKTGRCAF